MGEPAPDPRWARHPEARLRPVGSAPAADQPTGWKHLASEVEALKERQSEDRDAINRLSILVEELEDRLDVALGRLEFAQEGGVSLEEVKKELKIG